MKGIVKGAYDMTNPGRNSLCWCGSGLKYKKCHYQLDELLEKYKHKGILVPSKSIIKNQKQIAGIKESAKINIAVLDEVSRQIEIGMSTQEIDDIVAETTKRFQAIAAPLNYEGFPKSSCVSINNQVCHGIPSEKVFLKDGDIVNVDVSTIYKGYFSDSSRMFCIGDVTAEKKKLVEVAKKSLEVGLEQVKPFGFLGDVGEAIYHFVKNNGYSVVREIGGHGIGLEFHEKPWVGYVSKRGTGMLMVPGMCFTIEPMINMGRADICSKEQDGWPVYYTADGSASAQWEIQVLVTENGHEIIAY